MSAFERLHPALQHHIVNSLGWRELRPFQEEAIPSILDGKHMIVLAPTAGGKTEAAFFPALSRMLTEDWRGLGLLYVCPIKALLNNLDLRLRQYASLVGRRSALWHGDVSQSEKHRILREPPDCLLTTPESLEVMLVSSRVDSERLFANLRVVVIDEVHAFAGDDRGWHLLSVLERVTRLAGRELQRVGLSATVGNPEELVEWLAGHCEGERALYRPAGSGPGTAEVQLDYVGTLANAAVVISRLHRGEKRLVFVDSRSRAEGLGNELRELEVDTFVSHGSLSAEERRASEEAFASRRNCVIVATSALELGIDVGDLDRVIQIDSPPSVSSFLQRMGRTGRRAGTTRNCLFLATKDTALVQAAALIALWNHGWIEPVEPPPVPFHIFSQQIMALALQERGITRAGLRDWIGRLPAFRRAWDTILDRLLRFMTERTILWDDNGILWFGEEGEKAFGRQNFIELISVFTAPPLFTVLHGREEIGYVDQLSFAQQCEGALVLSLAGRSWKVNHIDWPRRVVHAELTDEKGRSRWRGDGAGLGFELSQMVKTILTGEDIRPEWSRRAVEKIAELRAEHAWLQPDGTTLRRTGDGEYEWWTFGGMAANLTLAGALGDALRDQPTESCLLTLRRHDREVLLHALQAEQSGEVSLREWPKEMAVGLKFSQCIPAELLNAMLSARLLDFERAAQLVGERMTVAESA